MQVQSNFFDQIMGGNASAQNEQRRIKQYQRLVEQVKQLTRKSLALLAIGERDNPVADTIDGGIMTQIQPYTGHHPLHSQILLIPGDPLYEKLIKEDPKKLKRLIWSEQMLYQKTHAPGWDEQWRIGCAEARAFNERVAKKSTNAKLLGLDTCTEPLTKRIVTNAYRRMARKLHPDVGGDAEAFKELHTAYRAILAATPKE